MYLARISHANKNTYASVNIENETIQLIDGDVFNDDYKVTEEYYGIQEFEFQIPICPKKVIALGYNYKDLVGEKESYDEPVIFFKPPSSLLKNHGIVKIPLNVPVWTEVELAIIIKKEAKNVSVDSAKEFILGYTVANDITTKNINGRDHHLARSKGWDTFCPIGSFINTEISTDNLNLKNCINSNVTQNSNTRNRILNDYEIVSLISRMMTLYPGDLILTGTPANAEKSIINSGDIIEVSIDGIGSITNTVEPIKY